MHGLAKMEPLVGFIALIVIQVLNLGFEMSVFCVLRKKKRLEGLEEVGKGGKTLDHVCMGKRTRRGLKTFLMKCFLENKRSAELNVCAWSAWRRHKRSEEVFSEKTNTPLVFLMKVLAIEAFSFSNVVVGLDIDEDDD
ncbi:hypothetical protein Hdeb2414_s0020g00560401 [Helianthus debilis subsp. tardiflorus]